MKRTSRKKQQGFTLVELAIVLVIIGLIVGGVLAGQDLIKAATIRAQSTQLSQYDTGALTFQNKYNGLPGDLLWATGNTNFTLTALGGSTGTNGIGDGNGLIESVTTYAAAGNTLCTAAPTGLCLTGEAATFWYELRTANLITDGNVTNANVNATPGPVNTIIPNAKLGQGAQVTVQATGGLNYLAIGNFGGPTAVPATGIAAAANIGAMSPLTAGQLDGKLDDGAPGTGKVVNVGVTPATVLPGTPAATGAALCAVSATAYNTGATYGNNNTLCALSIRASF